jgi:hypothetical protein
MSKLASSTEPTFHIDLIDELYVYEGVDPDVTAAIR